ncbi:MAG: siroheme synthase CysG [Alphaproteobacteria bacterium]
MARKLDIFPAFVRVAGRPVVVVGNGEEAVAKARLIGETAARLIVISANPSPALRALAENAGNSGVSLALIEQEFDAAHFPARFPDAALVFAATGDRETDAIVVAAARSAGIPVNAVDNPDLCDFLTPALVNRAPVAIAISTTGAGPVLARQIRERIEQVLPARVGDLAALAAGFRQTVEKLVAAGKPRRTLWQEFFAGPIADAVYAGKESLARSRANRLINHTPDRNAGMVALVGAGPGATDLLTLRAQRLLQEADVIVHDRLVPDAVIAMGRRDARRIDVGKSKGACSTSQPEINDILVREAAAGHLVVRLKGGDPLIFGRAGEEIAALRKANIAIEIVPGITSALAAAAQTQIPLTLRGTASSLVFTTGVDQDLNTLPDWAGLALSGASVAVYMARTVASSVSTRLIGAGLDPQTPIAIVENASRDEARTFTGTIAELSALPTGNSRSTGDNPALILIGRSIAHGALADAFPLAHWADTDNFIQTQIQRSAKTRTLAA